LSAQRLRRHSQSVSAVANILLVAWALLALATFALIDIGYVVDRLGGGR
jgi:hypothetical protein